MKTKYQIPQTQVVSVLLNSMVLAGSPGLGIHAGGGGGTTGDIGGGLYPIPGE